MKRLRFYQSTLGMKVLVAVTGALMVAFLVGHVLGNLKVFLPDPEPGIRDIDVYADFLRSVGEPILPRGGALWLIRLTVLAALVIHVVLALKLSVRNRRARPKAYVSRHRVQATPPARWMMVTGLLVFAFIVFHILHFTTGTIEPASFEAGAVYANLYRAFTRWPFVALYVVAMGLVALHLYHGAWSMFQTLGLDNPDRNRLLRRLAVVVSLALFLGFITVPIAIVAGAADPPLAQVTSTEAGGD